MSLQALVFVTFLCKLDWEKAAEEVGSHIIFSHSASLYFFLPCLMYLKLKRTVRTVLNVSDQALVRAGVKITKEKEMVELEDTGE